MKISNKTPNPMQQAEIAKSTKLGGAEAALEGKKSKPSVGVADSTRVDLSPRAQEMAKAKELATPSNDIDEAKVARLQALIDSGKYKIDASAIADRLVDEHTKMP